MRVMRSIVSNHLNTSAIAEVMAHAMEFDALAFCADAAHAVAINTTIKTTIKG